MRAIATQIRTAILRRRAQTATVLVICAMAGAVSTMAMTLLARSSQPFDDARARYAGADLTFHFSGANVRPADLAATASLPGVTTVGPAQPTVQLSFRDGSSKGHLFLIGRDDPGGSIDRIPIAAGRWPRRSGEIAVTRSLDSSVPFRPRVGDTVQALSDRGNAEFKVVGEVVDLGGHGQAELDFSNVATTAWVLSSDIAQFVDDQHPLGLEIPYRFRQSATADQLAADRRLVEASLPPDKQPLWVADWLRVREGSIWLIELISSIVLSFTIFAILAVTLIVAGVIAGAVLSNYRDIGIAKALGFTPAEVLAVYVGQMLVLALVGGLLGVPLGALMARPLLNDAANSTQLPAPPFFDPVVAAAVPIGLAVVVALAALVPALRAAATDSVRAITLGTAPPPGRRSRIAAALAWLRAPRSLSLGAGDAFARPIRSVLTVTALAIGVATATFGITFQGSLDALIKNHKAEVGYGQDVVVFRYPGYSDEQLTGRLAEQPETRVVIGVQQIAIRLAGSPRPDVVYGMRGDPREIGWRATHGRWYSAPGEAVVSPAVAKEAHTGIGGTISGTLLGGAPLTLRVVGFINDFVTNGVSIRTSFETLAAALPGAEPDQYLVKLEPGADRKAFAQRIAALAPNHLDTRVTALSDNAPYVNLLTGMVDGLALVLMLIAAAGVFNATLFTTRERVRDIAVLKAVGMTGSQIASLALGSTLVIAVAGTVIGIPAGIWLANFIYESMATLLLVEIPVVPIGLLPLLIAIVAAFLLALAGAALPARWAAATPVALVLRSE